MAKRKRKTQRDDANARGLRATPIEPAGEEVVFGEAWQKLKAEWTHDYGLRRMEDRGVKYEDATERKRDHQHDRETLLLVIHRLSYEVGYAGFRQQYFDDPDAIKEWPDSAAREQGLRVEWLKMAEENSPSTRDAYANVSTDKLPAYRDFLAGKLAGSQAEQVDYYNQACERGRHARLQASDYACALDDTAAGAAPEPGQGQTPGEVIRGKGTRQAGAV